MQQPTVLLAILRKMAQKPEVTFEKLYQKLYNTELWEMAYERIAPTPGNMTPGVDGKTADGMSLDLIDKMIADLKASRYKPTPVRRVYIEKANGKLRPLGIPSFRDKLLQTVVKLILEAIYEPTFSHASHGFRPHRSCHTALAQVKKMNSVRWWVEGDIKGFFDNLSHETLIRILHKRIKDNRFLYLVNQLMQAGYVEEWRYHRTYSGTPQGGNLSPLLSNIYLHELDQAMEAQIAAFRKGEERQETREYRALYRRRRRAKEKARRTGDWSQFKDLTQQMLTTPVSDPQAPDFRRMYYVRYADDFLVGIVGSKDDARATKAWLTAFLAMELNLELSTEKTLITHVDDRVRFLGYDIQRWKGQRIRKLHTKHGPVTKRVCTQQLALLIPRDKCAAFAKRYGAVQGWHGQSRRQLLNLSELEILMTYNAEIRGFLGYYALAENYSTVASALLWLTTTSFFRTLAHKRRSSLAKVARSLKQGVNRYVVTHERQDGTSREYVLVSSTKYLEQKSASSAQVDNQPNTWVFRGRTELGQRLEANQCEWCGTQTGRMEVHHVRKLKDLQGKALWERIMIERRRKTMVLCHRCHVDLHAGRLTEATKRSENRRAGYMETCTSGSEGSSVKPVTAM